MVKFFCVHCHSYNKHSNFVVLTLKNTEFHLILGGGSFSEWPEYGKEGRREAIWFTVEVTFASLPVQCLIQRVVPVG